MPTQRRSVDATARHPAPPRRRWLGGAALLAGIACLTACAPERPAAISGGQLHITTEPEGAAIACDSRAAAEPSPTTLPDLPPGEHLIVATKPGFMDARVTAQLKPDDRQTINLKLEPIEGLVLIRSKPSGADVEINNSHYGKTPLLITRCPIGKHQVRLRAPGFTPKTVDLTVEDRTPQELNINLESDFAKVLFESSPSGAQVTVAGAAIGNTPCEAPRLPSGKHRLSIALAGHVTYEEELSVQAGEERSVSVKLTARPGRLSVVSIPPKARLHLNGQYRGETPFAADTLPPGAYAIRVELAGYAPQTRDITVAAGGEAVEEFQLVKDSGMILVSTEPAEVTLILDGEQRGTTRALGQAAISAQLTIDLVPRGSHKLQLTKSGYFDHVSTVDITNQTLPLHFKLKPRPVRFAPTHIVRTGSGAEHTFRGMNPEKFSNGDVRLEIEPGIFRTFKATEIQSFEPLANP